MKRLTYLLLPALATALLAGCGTGQENSGGTTTGQPATTEKGTVVEATGETGYTPPQNPPPAPEAAPSPPLDEEPAGRVVEIGDSPKGIAADPETGLVAVGLRNPDLLALVDGESGEVVRRVEMPESARHLRVIPGGPVLVPAERADLLVQVGLPEGEVISETPVGKFPHGAAAYGGRVFVINELGNTLSVIEGSREVQKIETPLQPGGVATTDDGLVAVVGVRALAMEVFDAETLESLGIVGAGEGPTHVVAAGDRFYVTDTRGDAVLVYRAAPEPELLYRLPLPGGSPYGIEADERRGYLWVSLAAENRLIQYDISGDRPREVASYPTVRQPNSLSVNSETGRVFVAGRANGELQILTPSALEGVS